MSTRPLAAAVYATFAALQIVAECKLTAISTELRLLTADVAPVLKIIGAGVRMFSQRHRYNTMAS